MTPLDILDRRLGLGRRSGLGLIFFWAKNYKTDHDDEAEGGRIERVYKLFIVTKIEF